MFSLGPDIEAKYEVLQKMGEGGMGSVYKVRHRLLDEIQVIKLMQAKFQGMAELKARFLREAKTAKQLRHPNIAEVIDFNITADGTAYIVMEFIEGVNLHDMLARSRSPLNADLVIIVGEQALKALGFLHRKKFVHRDISPDNLMLTRDSEGKQLIKLIDLGITKSVESTQNLTMAGKFMGKVHYASPEQFGGDVDQRSDLYSFGVVLYELLTHTRPIEGKDYLSIITGHLTKPPRPFSETDPEGRIPSGLRKVIFKALEKDPANRFQNADEFAAAIIATRTKVDGAGRTLEVPLPAAPEAEIVDDAERDAWITATDNDTVKSWEAYLETYGGSSRAGEARNRLEQLEELEEDEWTRANAADTADAWRSFLANHGESPRAAKARRRLDKLEAAEAEEQAWQGAVSTDSVTEWELFLSGHASSAHMAEAKARLTAARGRDAEAREWRNAEAADSSEAWREFLKTHGSSPRVVEAKKRLDAATQREGEERAWNRAFGAGTVAAWEEYLRAHPQSPRVEGASANLVEAKKREVERADWKSAVDAGTSDAWRRYLDAHGDSARAAEASKNLKEAAGRESAEARQADERRAREAEERRRAEELRLREEEERREVEEAAWTSALGARSTGALEEFARAHPDSPHTRDVRDRIADLRRERARAAEEADWTNALQTESMAALNAYLQRHPQGAHVVEARDLIEKIDEQTDWDAAVAAADIDAWKSFVARHKRSPRVSEAKSRIAEIEAEREKERLERKRAEDEARRVEQEARRKRVEEEARQKKEAEARRRETEQAARKKKEEEAAQRAEQARRAKEASQVPSAPTETMVQPPVATPQRQRLIVGAIAVALIVGGLAFAFLRPSPSTSAGGEVTPPPVKPPVIAPAASGQLIINALPWGEVRSVRSSSGKEMLSKRPVYTPVALTLPVDTYQVELINPNSNHKVTLPAKVDAGRAARYEAQLDGVNADEYLAAVSRSQ